MIDILFEIWQDCEQFINCLSWVGLVLAANVVS